MSSAYGKIDRPTDYDSSKLQSLFPIEFTTQSNKLVSVHSLSTVLPQLADESKLVVYLQSLRNKEIEGGNTYPHKFPMTASEFTNFFLSADAFIVVNGGRTVASDIYDDLEANVLSAFFIRPNFPGRCSHICNGGFITAPAHRKQGIGRIMGLAYLQIAPLLGYKASMFNLVFASNTASVRLWRSLGFQEIGRVPNAGLLVKNKDGEEEYVDAIMFYYSFA